MNELERLGAAKMALITSWWLRGREWLLDDQVLGKVFLTPEGHWPPLGERGQARYAF